MRRELNIELSFLCFDLCVQVIWIIGKYAFSDELDFLEQLIRVLIAASVKMR